MVPSLAKTLIVAALAFGFAAPQVFAGERPKAVTFDDLKFDIEKGEKFERSMLTPEIEDLDGKRISLQGYMRPSFQQDGIKSFVFVRDNMECCFGPGAYLFDCVLVHMQGDATASFSVRPMKVEGVFRIEEYLGPEGEHLAVFRIDGVSAR